MEAVTRILPDEFAAMNLMDELATTTLPDELATRTLPDDFPTRTLPDDFPTRTLPDELPTKTLPDELPTMTDLPDHLVELIVIRMPFPSIFKTRYLSKAWNSKFSTVASLHNEPEEKRLKVEYFQALVREQAKNWGPLFPVRIDSDLCCTAYDSAALRFISLPCLSFLPTDLLKNSTLCCEGVNPGLLLVGRETMHVANIFTRSYAEVPSRPGSDCLEEDRVFPPKLLIDSNSDSYKLILLTQDCVDGLWAIHIYSSATRTWKVSQVPQDILQPFRYVYLNGVIYMAPRDGLQYIQALNVEDQTWSELVFANVEDQTLREVELVFPYEGFPCVTLAVCDAQLLMILYERDLAVSILKIDVVSPQLLKVSSGPNLSRRTEMSSYLRKCIRGYSNTIEIGRGRRYAVGHGNVIIFPSPPPPEFMFFPSPPPPEFDIDNMVQSLLASAGDMVKMMQYDVLKNKWSYLECPPLQYSPAPYFPEQFELQFEVSDSYRAISFQPGFDPFWSV